MKNVNLLICLSVLSFAVIMKPAFGCVKIFEGSFAYESKKGTRAYDLFIQGCQAIEGEFTFTSNYGNVTRWCSKRLYTVYDYVTPHNYYTGAVYYSSSYANAFQLCTNATNQPKGSPKESRDSCQVTAGNPIMIATGNKYQAENDYQSTRPSGLQFTRYYNSTANDYASDIGIKWRHSYSRHIKLSGSLAQVHRANDQVISFEWDGSAWKGDVDIPTELIEIKNSNNVRIGWEYIDSSDLIEEYNAIGQLIKITDRQGRTQTLSYTISVEDGGDGDDQTLDQVTNDWGETISFEYDEQNRIYRMTVSDDKIYQYEYSALGNLTKVIYPNDSADHTQAPAKLYHYDYRESYPFHLSGITDEKGVRYASWEYDELGRAISSEHANGVEKETLIYNSEDLVTVTNSLGKDTSYHFTTLHGVKKVTQVEGHPTESCAGANQHYTYDANGYLANKTDWQGNITTYIHDNRGLETSRTEAVGTPAERTITTQWHPDFRLPTQITEPGKVTTYTYDSNGKRINQSITE